MYTPFEHPSLPTARPRILVVSSLLSPCLSTVFCTHITQCPSLNAPVRYPYGIALEETVIARNRLSPRAAEDLDPQTAVVGVVAREVAVRLEPYLGVIAGEEEFFPVAHYGQRFGLGQSWTGVISGTPLAMLQHPEFGCVKLTRWIW